MGWIVHHATIVTTWNRQELERARVEAVRLFGDQVSGPMGSVANGYWSFFIGPDGSKEGWPDSAAGNQGRASFRAWITQQAYEDGSNRFQAVEVAYGELEHPVVTAYGGAQLEIVGDDEPDLIRVGRAASCP